MARERSAPAAFGASPATAARRDTAVSAFVAASPAAAAAAAVSSSARSPAGPPARRLTGQSSLAATTSLHEAPSRLPAWPLNLGALPKLGAVGATSVAAVVESFYRSGMNSILNLHLTGVRTPLLPQMHVQIPIRLMYINGFKQMRAYVDRNVDVSHLSGAQLKAAKLALACAPGVAMTPIVSVLEACNATTNPLPLHRRWTLGVMPRGLREIIFGIGINQLSDHFAGVAKPLTDSKALQTAAGSIVAGVLAGYFSHVPHNLSALKLMYPRESYSRLMKRLIVAAKETIPKGLPKRNALAVAKAFLAPKGVHIRTAQVVGSFVILNGIISLLSAPEPEMPFPALQDDSTH